MGAIRDFLYGVFSDPLRAWALGFFMGFFFPLVDVLWGFFRWRRCGDCPIAKEVKRRG